MGTWIVDPFKEKRYPPGTTPIVLPTVPGRMTPAEITEELVNSNVDGGSGFQGMDQHIYNVIRLNKRNKADSQEGKQWVSSGCCRVIISERLGKLWMSQGHVAFHYRMIPVRPYNMPTITCFNCGKPGHLAKFCRGDPHCRNCGGGHPMRDCPRQQTRRVGEHWHDHQDTT